MDMGTGYNQRQRTEVKGKLQERREWSKGAGSVQRLGDRSPIRECDIGSVRHLCAQESEVQVRLTPACLGEWGDGSG